MAAVIPRSFASPTRTEGTDFGTSDGQLPAMTSTSPGPRSRRHSSVIRGNVFPMGVPGALISREDPLSGISETLTRVFSAIGTAETGSPSAAQRSASICPTDPPRGATVRRPIFGGSLSARMQARIARETLIPLPPAEI